MKRFDKDKARKDADKWFFNQNSHKWSNNDDTAGDNFGSFMAGVKWQSKRMYTQEEVEKLLDIQRGNCYVAVYDKTLDTKMASFASGAPEPWGWKKIKKKKIGLDSDRENKINSDMSQKAFNPPPPPPEERVSRTRLR